MGDILNSTQQKKLISNLYHKYYGPKEPNKKARDNFIRISGKRLNKALESLRLLSNCAKRGQYDWTEDDAHDILDLLSETFNELKEKLLRKKYQKRGGF